MTIKGTIHPQNKDDYPLPNYTISQCRRMHACTHGRTACVDDGVGCKHYGQKHVPRRYSSEINLMCTLITEWRGGYRVIQSISMTAGVNRRNVHRCTFCTEGREKEIEEQRRGDVIWLF